MKKTHYLIFISCLLGLISCDNDEGFEMLTKKSYLLAEDSLTKSHKILKIENKNVSEWTTPLNINGEIGDICGKDNHFWISDVKNKEIIQFNAFDESKIKTFITNVTPHYLCIGESHLLVCDTIENKIDYINLNNSKIQTFSLSEKPSIPAASNHKFYLKEGENNLGIYDEANFGKRENIQFKYNIRDIHIDVNGSVSAIIITKSPEDSLYLSRISLLTDGYSDSKNWREEIMKSPYQKARFSPYSNKAFGKETLTQNSTPVSLYNGKIAILTTDKNISDFEIDFFESQIFYLKSSKLYQYDIAKKQISELSSFSGSLLKSYFYIDFKEAKKTK